jgi:hypothetical protein
MARGPLGDVELGRGRRGGGRGTAEPLALQHHLDLLDDLAHRRPGRGHLVDAPERQLHELAERGEVVGVHDPGVDHVPEPAELGVRGVEQPLRLADDVLALLDRLLRHDQLEHDDAEAVDVALLRQLLGHVVLRVQVPLQVKRSTRSRSGSLEETLAVADAVTDISWAYQCPFHLGADVAPLAVGDQL